MTKPATARPRRWVPCGGEAVGSGLWSVNGPIEDCRWRQAARPTGRQQAGRRWHLLQDGDAVADLQYMLYHLVMRNKTGGNRSRSWPRPATLAQPKGWIHHA